MTPLRSIPSFTSIARLDISFSVLIEVLPLPSPWKKSHRVGLGIVGVGWRARPRHQKFPALTWVGPRRYYASPGHPILDGQQSRSFEVVDRLRERDMSHRQSNWLCSLRGLPFRDTRSSRFDIHQRLAADCRQGAPYKAASSCFGEHRVLPRIGFLAQF